MTQIGGRTTGGVVKISLSTGGGGYTSSPSVSLSGGGGAGATAYAVMAGSLVDSVIVHAAGTGYTTSPTVAFSGGGGTGAAGTATVHASSMRYLSFFKGRYNDMYGVDGMGRGVRWNGADASVEQIGIHRPLVGPTLAAASATTSSVIGIQIVNGGAGYNNPPLVAFAGGGGSGAVAAASIANGRVSSISIVNPGSGYTAAPAVSFSGGIGSGTALALASLGACPGSALLPLLLAAWRTSASSLVEMGIKARQRSGSAVAEGRGRRRWLRRTRL